MKKSTLRNKCDKLLQDYIKAKYKTVCCYLCGSNYATVGHHFVYKSQSNATRYYLPNIIPLCQNCHCLIHAQPSMSNAKITLKMGQEWFNDLEEVKRQGQKFTTEWINNVLLYLQSLQDELEGQING